MRFERVRERLPVNFLVPSGWPMAARARPTPSLLKFSLEQMLSSSRRRRSAGRVCRSRTSQGKGGAAVASVTAATRSASHASRAPARFPANPPRPSLRTLRPPSQYSHVLLRRPSSARGLPPASTSHRTASSKPCYQPRLARQLARRGRRRGRKIAPLLRQAPPKL